MNNKISWVLLAILFILLTKITIKISGYNVPLDDFFFHDVSKNIGKDVFFSVIITAILLKITLANKKDECQLNKKKSYKNYVVSILSIMITLLLIEVIMRPFSVVFSSGHVNNIVANSNNWSKKYQLDSELGYIPQMGENMKYSAYATKHNSYKMEKNPDSKRILFIGDSIIDIGLTQKKLSETNRSDNIEWWSSGVGGYSSFQELRLYERYQQEIGHDILVIGFCLNDFDGTPVILREKDGKMVFVSPYLSKSELNPWLYKNSILYRAYITIKGSIKGRKSLVHDTKNIFKKFKNMSIDNKFALKVIVYPIIDHQSQWGEKYLDQHNEIIQILDDLEIEKYDLKPVLKEYLEQNSLASAQMVEGDYFHPSEKFSKKIANHLIRSGLLE